MLYARIDKNFRTALLADVDAEAYSAEARRAAINLAVKEYSRYRPLMRRYGTGEVYESVASGTASILLLGGGYAVGAQVTVGFLGANTETLTVLSSLPATDYPEWQAGTPSLVTFTANFAFDHNAGEQVTNKTTGLTLTAGVDTYLLPADFLLPERASFDIAVGARLTYRRQEGFYDASYSLQKKFNPSGYGTATNYGSGNYNLPSGQNPNGIAGAAQTGSETVYRFIEGAQNLLIITPAPATSRTLNFFYLAERTLANIRDSEEALLLHYARYALLSGQAAVMAGLEDYSEDDVHETGTANANALAKLADSSLDEWNKQLRGRPVLVSG